MIIQTHGVSMIPWTVDAHSIGEINEKDLVITPSIKEFIDTNERDRILFVVAPKGIGKSLLLIYKRQLFEKIHKNEEIYMIPRDMVVDRGLDIIRSTLTNEKAELLADHPTCKQLWKFCISLSVLKNMKNYYNSKRDKELEYAMEKINKKFNITEELSSLIENNTSITPSDVFIAILKMKYNDIINTIALQNHLSEIIRNYIRSGVAVFIDNVDQSFEDLLRSEKDIHQDLLKKVWYAGQIGLILAVYELSMINSHVKVFVTIRKEAFQKMRKMSSLGSQIRGNALDIAYSAYQLKSIFLSNIRIMDEKDLIYPDFTNRDPIFAFLGLDNNEIESKGGKREDIFCYMHRHSLKRPRDLMFMGKYLQRITPPSDREPDSIRSAIHSAAYEVITDFLAEIYPFAEIDFDRLFGLIPSNVMSKNEILSICEEYNKTEGCNEEKCDKCRMTHVFCGLYKFGLLGVVVPDLDELEKIKYIQKFVQVGEIDYDERILPISDYYLTHPALKKKIQEDRLRYRKKFDIDPTIIIGDGYSWKEPYVKTDNSPPLQSEHVDLKKNKSNPYFLIEGSGSSAQCLQKIGKDGRSESDSKTLQPLTEQLLRLIESDKEILWLDVGCGNGRCLEVLDKIENRCNIFYHGIDRMENLNAVTKKAEAYGIRKSIERLYVENLTFINKYDIISAILLFHEVNPLELPDILRNLLKALKDDGILVVSDFQEPYENEPQVIIWTQEDIKIILNNITNDVSANFSIIFSDISNELSFYKGFIQKPIVNDTGFDDFSKNYRNFLFYKEYKMLLDRTLLRIQMKTQAKKLLNKNDGEDLTYSDWEQAEQMVEPDYEIKGKKSYLLTCQIEYIRDIRNKLQ